MPGTAHPVDAHSLLGRAAGIGMAVCGVIGAIAGLIVGLMVHPPTAVFAMVELGIPATVVGGILGFLVGLGVWTVRRIRAGEVGGVP